MNQEKKLKVASCSPKNNGCFWYRNKTPFDALRRKGHTMELADFGDAVDLNYDMVQLSRNYGPGYEKFFYLVKQAGIKVWYDVDDAVDLVMPFNPFAMANKETLGSYYFLLGESDFITTSSENMKKHLETKTQKPVYVFPNYLNPKEWKERPKTHEGLRIGFAGSASHLKDLNMIVPVLKELQSKYDFTLVLYGLDTDLENSVEVYRERQVKNCQGAYDRLPYGLEVEKMYKVLKTMKVEMVDSVRWEMHPRTLANLDLDIGICPLIDDEFNACKTPIKFYEYAMTGTPSICSDITPFKEEALALAENSFQGWYDALEAMIIHDELRQSTLEAQRAFVMKNRLIDDHVSDLEAIIKQYAR